MRAILMLGLLAAWSPVGAGAMGQRPTPSTAELDRVRQEVLDRINRGADPVADAAEAVRRRDFRLITLGRFEAVPAGVSCFTPHRQAPEKLTHIRTGDVYDEQVARWYGYASTYNRILVDAPAYPDADLCRVASDSDAQQHQTNFPITTAARQLSTPPSSLHEAARRGSANEVRRLLAGTDADALDGLDMTPLAWAVARDNAPAIDALLRAGANPWVRGYRGQDAVFWAAQFGRRAIFQRLERMPGRPFDAWPPVHLAAAASGGDAAIIERMLEQPHAPFRFDLLGSPLPSAAALEPILEAHPELADEWLWEATDHPADRPDLVRLALRHGARPDAGGNPGRYGTVLGAFANGISPASVEIVEMLLEAGADPNLISHRQRPVWIAVGGLRLGERHSDLHARAAAIFHALQEAGADLNLPDDQGVPPARSLLFPFRGSHDRLDASFVTPSLLELLVRNGLDLNSRWQGQTILPLVEAQAGEDSELATTLRRLGARH